MSSRSPVKKNCVTCRHAVVLAGREPCSACLRGSPAYGLWEPLVSGAPPAGGWVKWSGGACPVDQQAKVAVEYRDGAGDSVRYAHELIWRHTGSSADIVRYRVVSSPPVQTPAVSESAKRKGMPLFSGCLAYFPDALLAVGEHSRKANDKHNPGQPLHWSKDKSKDHADCIARHLVDIGPDWDAIDPEFGSYHATALAWRALALLQTVIERKREPAAKPLAIDSAALR